MLNQHNQTRPEMGYEPKTSARYRAARKILDSPALRNRVENFCDDLSESIDSSILQEPWSSGQRALVEIALCLVLPDFKINLHDAIGSLDPANAKRVVDALGIGFEINAENAIDIRDFAVFFNGDDSDKSVNDLERVLREIGDIFVCLSQILDEDSIRSNPAGVAVAQRRFAQLAEIYTDGRFANREIGDISLNDLRSCSSLLVDIAAETRIARRIDEDLVGSVCLGDLSRDYGRSL